MINCRNFVEEMLYKNLLGLVLKRKASASTVLSSFLHHVEGRGSKSAFRLENHKNSNVYKNMSH